MTTRPAPSRIADKSQVMALARSRGQAIGVDEAGNLSAKVLAKIAELESAGLRIEPVADEFRRSTMSDMAAAYYIYDGPTRYVIAWEALTTEQIVLDTLDNAAAEIDA